VRWVFSDAEKDMVKILCELEDDSWHGYSTESLWAEPISGGRYRLRNSPFFALGVSVEDIVLAQEKDGILTFAVVSMRGGHSTYRILKYEQTAELFDKYWQPIQMLGCSYEEGRILAGKVQVLAVDIPPPVDIYRVYELLEQGESAGAWEFEEGHCGQLSRTVTD
jgi:Domain of unknown function (DUF4265)